MTERYNRPPRRWGAGHGVLAAFLVVLVLAFSSVIKMELVVNGLFLGMIIALGAIGLSLLYGILKFAHIAHGDFMTLGAYTGFFLLGNLFPRLGLEAEGFGPFTFGYPLLLAIPLVGATMAGLAIALDVGVYRRLRSRRVSPVVLAMASLGLAIALRGLVQIIWGGGTEQYPRLSKPFYQLPMGVRIPPDHVFIGALVLVLVLGLYLYLTRTKMGKAMRATSDNMDLARVSGISTERVIWWTWAVGAILAATAGVLLAVFQAQLFPIMGWRFLLSLFAAVILGGIGNPYGALVGALMIGVTAEVSTEWINPTYKPAIAFLILIFMLLVRPQGIFGEKA
ncbi:MAG: branched-chain amino acid ABC transporter permease [Dehalococcoidia bacterium]|nr:branched-chain amino acid ABC transporter permease [Dehalococcoidia bacterium]MDP6226733.1 branched-chain amino acid ABC transporter permease [Dehalococcoidia bacterium]MDP7082965.1 branched-chain amino acid ABC transporter permease [Dehalococcoidia bacterium]MDP7201192.1 branched-chain amino acid ABC transporter permease [Dehalococcoidia bacterium]MDP7510343.1 branched-chain amino acid ABC transporter permease [Dehalococcoidia bacterium]